MVANEKISSKLPKVLLLWSVDEVTPVLIPVLCFAVFCCWRIIPNSAFSCTTSSFMLLGCPRFWLLANALCERKPKRLVANNFFGANAFERDARGVLG